MTLPKFGNDHYKLKLITLSIKPVKWIWKTVKICPDWFQKTKVQVHQTEMLIITFTDDTQLAISTGSNVVNITSLVGVVAVASALNLRIFT